MREVEVTLFLEVPDEATKNDVKDYVDFSLSELNSKKDESPLTVVMNPYKWKIKGEEPDDSITFVEGDFFDMIIEQKNEALKNAQRVIDHLRFNHKVPLTTDEEDDIRKTMTEIDEAFSAW